MMPVPVEDVEYKIISRQKAQYFHQYKKRIHQESAKMVLSHQSEWLRAGDERDLFARCGREQLSSKTPISAMSSIASPPSNNNVYI